MWIGVLAVAIALALFAQVAAFFLIERPQVWGATQRPKSKRAH